MNSITADIDEFAVSLTLLVGSSLDGVKVNMRKAVSATVREGVKTTKEKARTAGHAGKKAWSEEYVEGFAGHVESGDGYAKGEIGNRNKPGLVHLLEHGHATINGGMTRAFPHMKPAQEIIEDDLRDRLGIAVEEGLAQ